MLRLVLCAVTDMGQEEITEEDAVIRAEFDRLREALVIEDFTPGNMQVRAIRFREHARAFMDFASRLLNAEPK